MVWLILFDRIAFMGAIINIFIIVMDALVMFESALERFINWELNQDVDNYE